MGSIPLPALATQTPPSPVDQFSKVIGIKSLLGQQQIQQQQATALSQENTLRAQQIKDQQLLMKAYMDAGGDLDKTAALAPSYGVSMAGMTDLQKTVMGVKEARAKLTDQELKNHAATNDQLMGMLKPVLDADPSQRPALWSTAAKQALDKGLMSPQEFQQFGNYPGDSAANMIMLQHQTASQQIAAEQKDREITAAETAATARATAARYKDVNGMLMDVSGETPQPALPQSMNPGDWDKLIDHIAPPDKNADLNARTKAQVNFSLGRADVTSAQRAITEAGQQIGSIEKETSPAVVQAKINEQTAVQRSLNATNNPEVANVAPRVVPAAIADAKKSDEAYITARQAADDMATFTREARAGNTIAYSYAPVEGVLTLNTARGVKRVNMSEIEKYGGAGSAADRVKAWLGKQVSGASIPDNILDDIDSIHSAVAQNAQTAYERQIQSTNARYHSSFQPLQFQTNNPQGQTIPSGATGKAKGSDGNWHYHDKDGNDLGVVH